MKSILLAILTLVFSSSAFAGIELRCEDRNENARPFNLFSLKVWGEDDAELENYRKASKWSRELARKNPIKGCERGNIRYAYVNYDKKEVYFECIADGDAGYGTFRLTKNRDNEVTAVGNIYFPNGNTGIPDDSKFQVRCKTRWIPSNPTR